MDTESKKNNMHYFYMGCALKQAEQAYIKDEVPIGSVIVYKNEIIGKGFNKTRIYNTAIAHAEMIAIKEASSKLKAWQLNECIIYSTLEPCSMCAGAIVLSRIKLLVFSLKDSKSGACGSVLNIVQEPKLNHRLEVISGIREQESLYLLQTFFQRKR